MKTKESIYIISKENMDEIFEYLNSWAFDNFITEEEFEIMAKLLTEAKVFI